VAADSLLREGAKRIALIDEYRHVGGNHLDCHIAPYTYDLGSLIFFQNSPFFQHFPELVPLYKAVDVPLGRVTPTGEISAYPISISKDVLAKGPVELARMVFSLVRSRLFLSRPANASEFARFWIGDRLFRGSGLASYMERFYGVRPEFIELDFAQKRMTWISDAASLRRRLKWALRRKKPSAKVQAMVRPYEGFARVYEAARRSLETRGASFFLGESITGISKTQDAFRISSAARCWQGSRLIGTIPIRRQLALCGLPDAPQLSAVTLASLFFSFEGQRGFSQSILYNFTDRGRWKRLTMHSDFYGRAAGREYFGVEVNLRSGDEIADVVNDFLESSRAFSLFKGDCRLEGTMQTENAYPVYTDGATAAAARAIAALEQFGIEAFGRQGGFDYLQSTAYVTAAVAKALAVRVNRNLPTAS